MLRNAKKRCISDRYRRKLVDMRKKAENLCLKQIFTTSEYFDIKYLIQVNETSKNVLTGQQEVFHEESILILWSFGNRRRTFTWQPTNRSPKTCSKQLAAKRMPIHGSGKKGFDRIDRYLNLSPEEKFLLKVYLVTCFNPDITFPSVSINGTNGSGKSTLSRIIKKIIDPSSNELETLPDTIDDLRVRLNQDYYLAFDNLSSISKKQSDFLCAAITGVTSSNRMKYTDNTINSVYIKRGMCLNGISPFVQKADLAERVLFFTAKLIKDTSRISDMTFWKDFSADLPYILGGIFDLYSKAMKILPTVKLQKLQRLADFHLFGYAVAEAMKTGLGKKFNEVLEDNKTRQMEITCQNAMIISLVEDFLKNEEDEGYWKGTMSLLYKSLKDFMSQQNMTEEIYNPRTYPKEANHLSRALHQYEAAFASKGIHFQSKKNSKGNMEIEITTDWLKDDIGTIKRVPIITSKT